jgi:hypothetical protein
MENACVTSPEARRYQRWMYALLVPTFAAIIGASWMLKNIELDPAPRLAVALAPVVLWGLLVVIMVAAVRHLDEMQQRIQLEALAITFPTAMMLGMLVEYLQKAGCATGLTVGDVWPWMFLIYLPAYFLTRLRYR